MKLSDFEQLVISLRAQSGVDRNPNITFWKSRTAQDAKAGPLESDHFMEFDFDIEDYSEESGAKTRAISQMVWDNKLVISAKGVRAKEGDFNFPIKIIDFYMPPIE